MCFLQKCPARDVSLSVCYTMWAALTCPQIRCEFCGIICSKMSLIGFSESPNIPLQACPKHVLRRCMINNFRFQNASMSEICSRECCTFSMNFTPILFGFPSWRRTISPIKSSMYLFRSFEPVACVKHPSGDFRKGFLDEVRVGQFCEFLRLGTPKLAKSLMVTQSLKNCLKMWLELQASGKYRNRRK